MRKFPLLANDMPDDKFLDHISFLAELAELGSMAAVALSRKTTPEAVAYHLHLLNKELGPVYKVRRGGKAELTELGWQILAVYQPLKHKKTEFLDFIATTKGFRPHAECAKPFPFTAKVYSGKDQFPRIKNVRKKLIIECLNCGLCVMVLLKSCVDKWLDLHDEDINGPNPLFRLHLL